MKLDIRPFPRLGWDPLPGEGVVGVTGRVLVREDTFFVAQLRFAEHEMIHVFEQRIFAGKQRPAGDDRFSRGAAAQ